MTDTSGTRSNRALWLGLFFTVLGPLSNWLYFHGAPAIAVVWITLFVPAVGLVFLLIGIRRAFREPGVYRGKIWGSVAAGSSVLVLAASVGFFFLARRLPQPPADAPQLGQRVPDFTLPDSDGHQVSLSQLLSGSAGGAPPRAVLLVFYRGYW